MTAESNTRKLVLGEDGRSKAMCECCWEERANQLHHRSKPGRVWSASNTLGVGPICHHKIEHNPSWAKQWRWWLGPGQHPVTTQCLLARKGWVFLHDDGSTSPAPEPERT